jgi:hypothetical protein
VKRCVVVVTVWVVGLAWMLTSLAFPAGSATAARLDAVPTAAAGSVVTPGAPGATGKPVTLSGMFVVVQAESRVAGPALYFLKSAGHQYQLRLAKAPNLRSGATVTVHGTLNGDTIDLAGVGGSSTLRAAAPAIEPPIGTRSVLVINVVWAGATLKATAAQEQDFMFGTDPRSFVRYYLDASYGQLTWTGAQTPRYTITAPTGCDLSDLANQAQAEATAGGYSIPSYDKLIINAPHLQCGSRGYGEIGGSLVWIEDGLWNLADGYERLLPAHEIGHALGLYHSHGLDCGDVAASLACLSDPGAHKDEYGHAFDVMGNNFLGDRHDAVSWFSAKQEMLLGWLSGSRVTPVDSSGTYSLVPLEKSGTASAQVLVIPTPLRTYYVEYRQPITQDVFLSHYPAATNSVHVSVGLPFGDDTAPYALDFTPGTNPEGADYTDFYDAPLAIGRSFSDPENAFTLSPISQNGTTATVRVTVHTLYDLSVTKSGTASGTVTSSPAGISCGTACSAGFVSDSAVTLTESPASGSTFSGWGGACTGTATTCTVPMSSATSVTAGYIESAPGAFTSLTSSRLLDTRSGVGAAKVAVAAGGTLHLQVASRGGVPVSGICAVVMNVSVTSATRSGYVIAYGDGTTRPATSNLNFLAGQTVPNLVIAPVGANGKVALYNGSGGTIQLIADVSGYYQAGAPVAAGAFGSLTPSRVLDTRSGVGAARVAVPAGGTVHLTVAGTGGVPVSEVGAVVLNVTVTAPARPGHVVVSGDGTTGPGTSNLNFLAGQTVPNLVIAPVGANGKVALYNGSGGTIQLIADVSGYYLAGTPTVPGTFGALTPSRVLDTRTGLGTAKLAVAAGGTLHLLVTGPGGVPLTGVSAVVLNVTVAAPARLGFVTVYGDGTTRPGTSNLNFAAGQTVPNLVTVQVGTNGSVALYNGSGGTLQLIADVTGYYRDVRGPQPG